MPFIVLADLNSEIDRRELTGPVVLGRAPECNVAIHDAMLSRRHCRIECIGDHWFITDLGSKNGTYVNNQIIQKRLLNEGDIVRIGRTRVRFHATAFFTAPSDTVRRIDRPADPIAALAGTISGIRYFGDDEFPDDPAIREKFPRPRPIPQPPQSLGNVAVQTMLMNIASSMWDEIIDTPSRAGASLPAAPMIDGQPTVMQMDGVTRFRPADRPTRMARLRREMIRMSLACAIGSTIAALWVVSWHL